MRQKKQKHIATRTRFSPLTIAMLIVLLLYTITLFGLLLWGVITTFKSPEEFRLSSYAFPRELKWNFGTVFNYLFIQTSSGQYVGLELMLLYSVLYAFGCAFFHTLVPCFTAYVCARFRFRFLKMFHTIVIIVMIIPVVGSLPSELQMARRFGLYDQIMGLWIMKANFLGMYFLVFYEIFKSLPQTFTEAAKVDGASNFTIMTRIALPLVRNTFFTVMLINFITFWNDYQTPLIYMPSYPPIARAVFEMSNTTITELAHTPYRIASAIILLVPIMVLFLAFQKRLLGNLSIGGLKG